MSKLSLRRIFDNLSAEMDHYDVDKTLVVADLIDKAAQDGGYPSWDALNSVAEEYKLHVRHPVGRFITDPHPAIIGGQRKYVVIRV